MASPHVPADAKLKKLYASLTTKIAAALRSETRSFDALWEAVARVVEHEPPLYVFGGFKTAPEYFERVLHEKPRTAWRNIRVAKHATAEDEAKYGLTLLEAAIGFVEAEHGPLVGSVPVHFDRLRIPVVRKGKKSVVLLAKATAGEVVVATQKASKKPTVARAAAAEAIASALSKHPVLAHVRVHERAGLLSFAGVPISAREIFGKTIAQANVAEIAGSAKTAHGRAGNGTGRGGGKK